MFKSQSFVLKSSNENDAVACNEFGRVRLYERACVLFLKMAWAATAVDNSKDFHSFKKLLESDLPFVRPCSGLFAVRLLNWIARKKMASLFHSFAEPPPTAVDCFLYRKMCGLRNGAHPEEDETAAGAEKNDDDGISLKKCSVWWQSETVFDCQTCMCVCVQLTTHATKIDTRNFTRKKKERES